ncbi:hypothetical protein OH786_35490 (plasmid) [Streptomyces atratus]|uniref:hypothetical protein n=1 Tax=Streptomyces atratus TaxID=1893 RepID=UPI00210DD25A|nr:hypothetical protein [Streptomyces atratus]
MNGPTSTATSWQRSGVQGSVVRRAASIERNASTVAWSSGVRGPGALAQRRRKKE